MKLDDRPRRRLRDRMPKPPTPMEALDVVRETAERRQFLRELKGIVAEKNYKPGFAAAKYREKYGDWPPYAWRDDGGITPSLATVRWVTSRAIAWAKSQARVA